MSDAPSLRDQTSSVIEVRAQEVKGGDVIWVHDDRDWMVVHSIADKGDELEFSRRDGSIAEFDKRDVALVRRRAR